MIREQTAKVHNLLNKFKKKCDKTKIEISDILLPAEK